MNGTLAYLDKIPPGTGRATAVGSIAGSYAKDNLADAMAWVETLELKEDRDEAVSHLLTHTINELNVDEFASFASEIGADKDPNVAVAIGALKARHDPREAVAYSAGVPEGDARDLAFRVPFGIWLSQDSIAASDYASKLEGGLQSGAAQQIVTYLIGAGDGDGASQWVEMVSPGAEKSRLLDAIDSKFRQGE